MIVRDEIPGALCLQIVLEPKPGFDNAIATITNGMTLNSLEYARYPDICLDSFVELVQWEINGRFYFDKHKYNEIWKVWVE